MNERRMEIRHFDDPDEDSIAMLWRQVFRDTEPHNDPVRAIRKKRAYDEDLFLVAIDGTQIIGTIMGGYDGHRGWIYSLAVAPAHRRQGIATALMRQMETLLRDKGCPKVNLQVRTSNHEVIEFYKKLNYTIEPRVSMGKLLSA
jgi:ribosomal protein S18 acetylase RimI-like enzyme